MLEYLFRIYPEKPFPEVEGFESMLRGIYGKYDLVIDYDDPLFSADDLPADDNLDGLKRFLVHNRPALGWTVTAEDFNCNGILSRDLKSVVLRGADDATVIQHAIHIGRWLGKNVYRLDFLAGDTRPVYLAIGMEPKPGKTIEETEQAGIFQLSLDGAYNAAFLSRVVPAMRISRPPSPVDVKDAEVQFRQWNERRVNELYSIPGYRSGRSCDETFFLRPDDEKLSVDEAAARLFAVLGLHDYVAFKDKRDYYFGYMDENWDIELQRAGYYDHPDYMFRAKFNVRLGEFPEAASWSAGELLDKTMAIIGLKVLEAGFTVVVDVNRAYFDYKAFQAREYYVGADENGMRKLEHRDIMMVKQR